MQQKQTQPSLVNVAAARRSGGRRYDIRTEGGLPSASAARDDRRPLSLPVDTFSKRMFRSRLFADISRPYLLFVLLASLLTAGVGSHVYERSLRNEQLARVRTVAIAVAQREDVLSSPSDAWRAGMQRLATATNVRITVIDGLGTPIADSSLDPTTIGDLAALPELRRARTTASKVEEIADRDQLVVVVPILAVEASALGDGRTEGSSEEPTRPIPHRILGYARAQGPIDPVTQSVTQWRFWAIGLTCVIGGAGLVLSRRTVTKLNAAIQHIARSAQAASMHIDDASAPVAEAIHNESLSESLATVASNLDSRTDRTRRDYAQLKSNAERLSTVLSGMAEGVIAIDRDERIVVANPAAASLLDLSEVPLIGRRLWEAVRVPAIRDLARRAFDGRESSQIEMELPRTQTAIALRASRLPGEPIPGVVLVLHDVTELRRLENLRREFVSNVSHELKTPLASIQAYTDTLLDGAIDDQEHNVKFLKRISEQAERLHHLIVDLLRLARIEAGTDVFQIQKLSANKVIAQSCDEHTAVARTKNVTLAIEPPDEPIRLRADPDGMRTILDNLLDNAINYTPAGGRVTVRWGREGDMVLIEVADTGIGIPAEHLVRVFERFHRVDKARDRERGGTGLGLAIVKHLVQVFEGRVEVESEVDRGSTFRVRLPLAETAPPSTGTIAL